MRVLGSADTVITRLCELIWGYCIRQNESKIFTIRDNIRDLYMCLYLNHHSKYVLVFLGKTKMTLKKKGKRSSHHGSAEMNLLSLRTQVQFLASPSGSRMLCCCERGCRSQTQLGSSVAVAEV